MVTDAQAEEIKRGLASGMRGPVLIKWCEQLLADRAERVAEEKRKAKATGRRRIQTRTMLTYTYVDNSNVFIEGQRVSAVRKGMATSIQEATENHILDFAWNIDYGRLHEFACGPKKGIGCARLWGSPPPGDSFWKMVEVKGFQVTIFDKGFSGKEKKVDVAIAHQMTKDAYTVIEKANSEITLVSGDADFVPVIEDLKGNGFRVCVLFWDHAGRELREAASLFTSLNPFLDHVARK